MKYIIMLMIVLGLAVSDFVTGLIKGYVNHDLNSAKMRKGGLNKIAELTVMATVCGLEIGIKELGKYYSSEHLAEITGAVAAIAVFCYVVLMEIVSILENYAEISKAEWVAKFLKRLKNVKNKEE